MYEIDKTAFGGFVAQLRRERGFTQKDLAQKLFISDKAVSKWETGMSIPDTALLIPLAQLLDVSVTELLMCQRKAQDEALDRAQVETLVKQSITYTATEQAQVRARRRKWTRMYLPLLLVACVELIWLYMNHVPTYTAITLSAIGAIFGGYFCFFAKERLPAFYDEQAISFVSDGFFRMSMPGIRFNNSNWPHILAAGRIWSLATMVGYPALCLLFSLIARDAISVLEIPLFVGTLIGLFVPIYIVGRRYQ